MLTRNPDIVLPGTTLRAIVGIKQNLAARFAADLEHWTNSIADAKALIQKELPHYTNVINWMLSTEVKKWNSRVQALKATRDPVELCIEITASRLLIDWDSPSRLRMFPRRMLNRTESELEIIIPLLPEAIENGDPEADRALRLCAQRLIFAGLPIPKPLREYVCNILAGQKPKLKQRRRDTSDRDRVIVGAIQTLTEAGCSVRGARSIVGKALERVGRRISGDALEKIWKRRKASFHRKGTIAPSSFP